MPGESLGPDEMLGCSVPLNSVMQKSFLGSRKLPMVSGPNCFSSAELNGYIMNPSSLLSCEAPEQELRTNNVLVSHPSECIVEYGITGPPVILTNIMADFVCLKHGRKVLYEYNAITAPLQMK